MIDWIKCNHGMPAPERIPPDGKTVLFYFQRVRGDGVRRGARFYSFVEYNFEWVTDNGEIFDDKSVTHWAELNYPEASDE